MALQKIHKNVNQDISGLAFSYTISDALLEDLSQAIEAIKKSILSNPILDFKENQTVELIGRINPNEKMIRFEPIFLDNGKRMPATDISLVPILQKASNQCINFKNMDNEIDWSKTKDAYYYGRDQAIKMGEPFLCTDIKTALDILRRFPKREKFTFNEAWDEFKHIPDFTKERLSFIIASIAEELILSENTVTGESWLGVDFRYLQNSTLR